MFYHILFAVTQRMRIHAQVSVYSLFKFWGTFKTKINNKIRDFPVKLSYDCAKLDFILYKIYILYIFYGLFLFVWCANF